MLGGRSLSCGARQQTGGDSNPVAPDGSQMRRAAAPLSEATHKGLLAPPIRSLASACAPGQIIVDCGGQGQCGPNTMAYLLSKVELFDGSGAELRLAVAEHGRRPDVRRMPTPFRWVKPPRNSLTMEELMTQSMADWPKDFRRDLPASAEAWCKIISIPEAWTDIAFVQLTVDLFSVSCSLTGVDDLGEVFPMLVLHPLDPIVTPKAWLEVGCWIGRHFVAIVDCQDPLPHAAAGQTAVDGQPLPSSEEEMAEWASFAWPLTTVEEFRRLLECEFIRPTTIVAMEFSGALREALQREGVRAISVDRRPNDAGGMHYQGDVRDVVHLGHWERAYLFPSCFQQLRGDSECLPYKQTDGRAFWGLAMVLWCVCLANADLVVVEQPDTILPDYVDLQQLPQTTVVEFHTSQYGDEEDKFVRLTCRRGTIPPFLSERKHSQSTRSPAQYRNAEQRDRERSSWVKFPHTCRSLASMSASGLSADGVALDYTLVVSMLAAAWAEAGLPVPEDYLNEDAQPTSDEERSYQLTRGVGDGRSVVAASAFPSCGAEQLATARQAADNFLRSLDAQPLAPDQPQQRPDRVARGAAPTLLDETLLDDDEVLSDSEAGGLCATRHDHSTPGQNTPSPGTCGEASEVSGLPCVDARRLEGVIALLVVVSVTYYPMVYAHVNGFTTIGIYHPRSSPARSWGLSWANKVASSLLGVSESVAFLACEFSKSVRLYVAPARTEPSPRPGFWTTVARAKACAAGAAFAWCSLAALASTPASTLASSAILAAQAFVGPVPSLPHQVFDEASEAIIGRSAISDILRPPQGLKSTQLSAWQAFASAIAQDASLHDAILTEHATDELLQGWDLAFRPLPSQDFPDQLLRQLSQFDDKAIGDALLPPVVEPYDLPPRPRTPLQPQPSATPPECPRPQDLYTPSGWHRLQEWLAAQKQDLHDIVRQRSQGVPPELVSRRHRPKAIAIGQTEMQPFAKGLVWDCRQRCCQPANYHAKPSTSIDEEAVELYLGRYPDQQLVTHLINGINLEADVELQTVLIPHLASLSAGVEPVMKEFERLHELRWNAYTYEPAFVPFYVNGNGQTSRKHEPGRPRPVTEGGGPRHPTFDESGLQAVSINEASRVHRIPQHYLDDSRPEFLQWILMRGLEQALRQAREAKSGSVKLDPQESAGAPLRSKWCKERKPTLESLLKALAVLQHAAHQLGESVYVFGDDVKNYFNHMGMAADELWKMNSVHLDPRHDKVGPPPLVFINELRIGFGMHPASNVAQRLSEALMHVFHDLMDEAEAAAMEGDEKWKTWRMHRSRIQQSSHERCHLTRRWWRAQRQPKGTAVEVCPQARLFAAFMYTDDPIFVVVGSSRTIRALRAWRHTTNSFGLTMAIPAKWSLGSWATWLGVIVFASLGFVVVPVAKLLRANLTIDRVLNGSCEFHEYRALCGLLEHLRAVNLQGKNIMHGLYRPHGPDGESAEGPQAIVLCDDLQRKQLLRWRCLLMYSAGVRADWALLRTQVERPPQLYVIADSDACHGDDPSAMGGVIHGVYWHLSVARCDYERVHTPMLEFLAVAINILQLARLLPKIDLSSAVVVLRTDALTAALTLPRESQRSPALVAAFQELIGTEEWARLAPHLRIVHIFGDANPLADAVSRAHWTRFRALCAQLGLSPSSLDVPRQAHHLLSVAMRAHDKERTRALRARPLLPLGSVQGGLADRLSARFAPPLWHQLPQSSTSAPAASRSDRPNSSLRLLTSRLASSPSPGGKRHPPHLRSPSNASSVPASPGPRAPLRPELPIRKRSFPALTAASRMASRRNASDFTQGDPSMAFSAAPSFLARSSDTLSDNALSGITERTADVDERAWKLWEHVCEAHGTNPMRTSSDAREFPQRNSHLLAALMLHAFASCRPRTKGALHIKPRSALAYPLAIIRIHSRWGVQLPPAKLLKASLHHLSRLYISVHGQYSLAPKRAEPMRFSMVVDMNRLPENSVVGQLRWTDANHDVFIFRRLSPFLFETAHRLAEIVGPTDYLSFSSLVWVLDGTVLLSPTPAQLRSMLSGRDYALVSPPRSKSDQFGEIHCSFPTALMLHDEPANAASGLRDLELRFPPLPGQRSSTPLFPDSRGQPYTHAFLDRLLKSVLTAAFGESTAQIFTWHSYRVGLATALYAAGVPDAEIQLYCRWMCPKSLRLYRRIGAPQRDAAVRQARRSHVHALQTPNAPRVAAAADYARATAEPSPAQLRRFAVARAAVVRRAVTLPPLPQQQRAAVPIVMGNDAYANAFRAARALPDSAFADDGHATRPATPPPHVRRRALNVAPAPAGPRAHPAPVPSALAVAPAHLWRDFSCDELGGRGWLVEILSRSGPTSLVRFVHARDACGRPYHPIRLLSADLLPPPPTGTN